MKLANNPLQGPFDQLLTFATAKVIITSNALSVGVERPLLGLRNYGDTLLFALFFKDDRPGYELL